MRNWQKATARDVRDSFLAFGRKIRKKELEIGRMHYALGLAHGVRQAIHCGYDKLVAVELGVAAGSGLLSLCQAAEYFRNEFGMDIRVYGFDSAAGLPELAGYKDHPEVWWEGQFKMPDPEELRAKLPAFAKLLIGDVGDTITEFESEIADYQLGFIVVDLDFYSSTTRAMKIFEMNPLRYVPALPLYMDDTEVLISQNPWCGEELAIQEFNNNHEFRKIERKSHFWAIHNFYVCHVLDHPVRTGETRPRLPFEIRAF
ncbi:MAG: hypothetical protein LBE78_04415 [Burkholderiaceae bacterium]|jgi:hypothetical protein|nr:hypothetical protein [Burkholderiaceae bacterium]